LFDSTVNALIGDHAACKGGLVFAEQSAPDQEPWVRHACARYGVGIGIDLGIIEGASLFGAGFRGLQVGGAFQEHRMILDGNLDRLLHTQETAVG
jgi:hypothetical protein